MKTRLDRKQLAAALAWLATALPKRPMVPVLSGVLIDAADGQVTLSATDYELANTCTLEADVADPGRAVVSGFLFRDLAAAMRGTDVDLAIDGDHVVLSAGRSSYKLRTLPVEDYPDAPPTPPDLGRVSGSALQHLARTVGYACDDDNSTSTLAGVFLEADTGRLHAAGTNRFRLAADAVDYTGDDFKVRIMGRHLADAAKTLAGDVTVGVDDNRIRFATPTRSSTMTTIAEQGPNWRQLLRWTHDIVFVVDVADLAAATKRAGLVVERNCPLYFDLSDGVLSLSTDGNGDLGDGTETVDVDTAGQDLAAANSVNADFLLDALAAVSTDRVSVGLMANTNQPFVLGPVCDPEEDDAQQAVADEIHVIMPLRPGR